MWTLVSLLALSVLVGADQSCYIRQLSLSDSQLIETSDTNYGIILPSIAQNEYKTVSINGDNVVMITPTCQVTIKNYQALSTTEAQLVSEIKGRISSIVGPGSQQIHGFNRVSIFGSSMQSVNNTGQILNFWSSGNSITSYDSNNYSVSRQSFGDGLCRVFVSNDVVTFVYQDGQVQMKPKACLQAAEQQTMQQVELQIQEAEEKARQKQIQRDEKMRLKTEEREEKYRIRDEKLRLKAEEREEKYRIRDEALRLKAEAREERYRQKAMAREERTG